MTIRRILDLSVLHLPMRFFQDDPDVSGWCDTELGVLLWVPSDPDDQPNIEALADDRAPEIVTLRRIARERGCDYVLLDQDADVDDTIPLYEATWNVLAPTLADPAAAVALTEATLAATLAEAREAETVELSLAPQPARVAALQESPARKAAWLVEVQQRLPVGTRVRVVASDVATYIKHAGRVIGYDVGATGAWPGVRVTLDDGRTDTFFADGSPDDEVVAPPTCANCGQWQDGTRQGYLDCFNECAQRGFASKVRL